MSAAGLLILRYVPEVESCTVCRHGGKEDRSRLRETASRSEGEKEMDRRDQVSRQYLIICNARMYTHYSHRNKR